MQRIGQMDKFKNLFQSLIKKKAWKPSPTLLKHFSSRKFIKSDKYVKCNEQLEIIHAEDSGANITLNDYSQWMNVEFGSTSWSKSDMVVILPRSEWAFGLYNIKNTSLGEKSCWRLQGFWEG